ncbi:prolyl oligopeptidase family serine peptidase [soil metagenome]
MNENTNTPSSGTTDNGVPYLVIPGSPDRVVAIWHLLDPPRTEVAMASALPLTGFDATKVYLGLPMSGSRTPNGGPEAIFELLARDAPALVHGPIFEQAVAEFPAAFSQLLEQFHVSADAAIGLVGGSMGSAIAAGVLADGMIGVRAAVLVSPMMQLRTMIDEVAPMFGGYAWSPAGQVAAERMDFVARAAQVVAGRTALRVILGLDDADGMTGPARAFATATGADVHELPGVGHALADEPGIAPAPQTQGARMVDALAAAWLQENLD